MYNQDPAILDQVGHWSYIWIFKTPAILDKEDIGPYGYIYIYIYIWIIKTPATISFLLKYITIKDKGENK